MDVSRHVIMPSHTVLYYIKRGRASQLQQLIKNFNPHALIFPIGTDYREITNSVLCPKRGTALIDLHDYSRTEDRAHSQELSRRRALYGTVVLHIFSSI